MCKAIVSRMTDTKQQISDKELAGCIDHTLLDATATKEQIEQLCQEALDFGFHTVCVNGRWVALAAELLAGSKVAVGGVVSLPLGADSTKIKVAQAKEAMFAGADEIDIQSNISIIEIIKQHLQQAITNIRSRISKRRQNKSAIRLLDSSLVVNSELVLHICFF